MIEDGDDEEEADDEGGEEGEEEEDKEDDLCEQAGKRQVTIPEVLISLPLIV